VEAAALALKTRMGNPVRNIGHGRAATVRVLRGAAVIGVIAYAVHAITGFGGHTVDVLFENWVFNGLLVASALLCLLRAWWSNVERAAWMSIGIGLGCWAIGEILFTIDPGQVTESGFPAPSDFLWLVFYPASFITLGLLVRARVRVFYPSLWLDGIVGALAIAALASQFVLPPIVAGTEGSLSDVIGDLVYPLGDLLLLAFVVSVLAMTGWRPGRVLGTVAIGLALSACADWISLYWSATGHSESGVFDSLWPASAVVLGCAAWQAPRPSAVIGLEGRRLLIFPMTFALGALGLLALDASQEIHDAAYILAVCTIAGVIARMGLTFSENLVLADRSREEALTDALTGLGNRRRLLAALEEVLQSSSKREPWALLLFDLNGFKVYNDTFGHPLGDALLSRLGAKLAGAAEPDGQAYRLGGDEFCVLARIGTRSVEDITDVTIEALSERGRGFDISTACGCIMLPEEAEESASAMALVDERLYADKRSRRSSDAPNQLRDVLLQVMAEREPDLHAHLHEVSVMARTIGKEMGMDGEDLEILVRAAELHDVGKVAVPEAILEKRATLEPSERAIIERHSEVGERILAASPAMGPVAKLVRSSHEHFDGNGYPDGRQADEIPMGARIISVCDAYHAMTTDRPYRNGMNTAAAIAELQREAGHQFDPRVVETFCALTAGRLDGAGEPPHSSEPVAVVDPAEVKATAAAKAAAAADPAQAAMSNHA
jgi:two-component system, cell cycle response regulator